MIGAFSIVEFDDIRDEPSNCETVVLAQSYEAAPEADACRAGQRAARGLKVHFATSIMVAVA